MASIFKRDDIPAQLFLKGENFFRRVAEEARMAYAEGPIKLHSTFGEDHIAENNMLWHFIHHILNSRMRDLAGSFGFKSEIHTLHNNYQCTRIIIDNFVVVATRQAWRPFEIPLVGEIPNNIKPGVSQQNLMFEDVISDTGKIYVLLVHNNLGPNAKGLPVCRLDFPCGYPRINYDTIAEPIDLLSEASMANYSQTSSTVPVSTQLIRIRPSVINQQEQNV